MYVCSMYVLGWAEKKFSFLNCKKYPPEELSFWPIILEMMKKKWPLEGIQPLKLQLLNLTIS